MAKNMKDKPENQNETTSCLNLEKANILLQKITEWTILTENGTLKLERTFTFKNFQNGLDFCNSIGQLAEEYDHHPLITLQWGEVKVTWWTHSINGLQPLDFTLAEKTNVLFIGD